MLLIIAAILGVLWLLGLLTATTLGGFIHVLIVVAVIIFIINLIRGKRPVA